VSNTVQQLYEHYLANGGLVSTDSRTIEKGAIFFALKGERFDGNQYAMKVLDKGASFAVVDSPAVPQGNQIMHVEDVLETLQQLAHHHRTVLDIPVIAITGSNGKTTTKELMHAVLSKKYKVHATKGNLNNHIGVPLTLLSAPQNLDLLIIEMGANHIGDIDELCQIADPSYGLITNIGHAHLEGFGSFDGVKQGKTELFRHLKGRDGTIFYNDNDKLLSEEIPENMFVHPYIDWLAVRSGSTFLDISVDYTKWVTTQLVGKYNATNMLCAATVGQFFGISKEQIIEAITEYLPTNNRSQIVELGSYTLVMDAYNANPNSMKESISSFAAMNTDLSKILILGDMAELGSQTDSMHTEILGHLSKFEWEDVFIIGPHFIKADTNNEYNQSKSTDELLISKNIEEILKDKMTLIKASRSMKLEQIETLIRKIAD